MADRIELYEYDQTYIQIVGDRGMIAELGEYFTFDVPNARYMPAYQNKLWDGKHRMMCYQTQKIYRGLLPYIVDFCKDRNYECLIDEDLKPQAPAKFDVDSFIKSLDLIYTPYDFQQTSLEHAINTNRATFLSPTSSGKSLIIYMMIRYYLEYSDEGDILICVPTIDLVNQLIQEFKDYSPNFDIESLCHKIYQGQDKKAPKGKRIIVSTWQSVYLQPRNYFKNFETVMVDECFDGDTKIKIPGGFKSIKDIKIGDKILNYCEKNKTFKEDNVVDIFENLNISHNIEMLELKFDDGTVLNVTSNHKILTSNRGWVEANNLTESDEIINY